ncbi:MAG: hypothetical protein LBU62_01550 [Bacteroidales bacterium]|jgi:hypothetical protein|nr:hypothetical protein [Bacteroidales bacterium]
MATIAFHRGKDLVFGTLNVVAGQSKFSLKRGETKIINMPDGACKITVKTWGASSKFTTDVQGDCTITTSSFVPYVQIIGGCIYFIICALFAFHVAPKWILLVGAVAFLVSVVYPVIQMNRYFKISVKPNALNTNG